MDASDACCGTVFAATVLISGVAQFTSITALAANRMFRIASPKNVTRTYVLILRDSTASILRVDFGADQGGFTRPGGLPSHGLVAKTKNPHPWGPRTTP
jgi:hypothetical protein